MTARYAGVEPAGATDEMIRGPLWYWPPGMVCAVKHERRKRFRMDHDDDGLPAVADE